MTDQNETSSVNYSEIAGQLLTMMLEWYPQFKPENPSTTREVWAAHLREYSPSTIERAMKVMIDAHPQWAPTIGQFKQLCKRYHAPAPHKRIQHKPRAAAGVANAELDKMRKALRKPNKTTEVSRETNHADIP